MIIMININPRTCVEYKLVRRISIDAQFWLIVIQQIDFLPLSPLLQRTYNPFY